MKKFLKLEKNNSRVIYNKYCCPVGKTRPTLEQVEDYFKQAKQTVAVNILGLKMEDKLSKIILDNSNCKVFIKDVDNGHNISIRPTKHKISEEFCDKSKKENVCIKFNFTKKEKH